jgi:hypothetical protein
VSDFGEALRALIEALGRTAIPYMIGGSTASGVHGIYRTSLDVDLVADIHPAQIVRLLQELGAGFYADEGMLRDALKSGRCFNLIHFASSYKFDIFPLTSDPFQQSQFSRRQTKEIVLASDVIALPVATAEDTLLMKLVWYRAGGEVSERQWNDVRGIAAIQRQALDREYLRRWAGYLKVADLLDDALASHPNTNPSV